MRKILFLTLALLYSSTYAQKDINIPIESLKGKSLIRVDSLSFDQKYLGSEFYIDSISEVPFTGNALQFYNLDKTSFDSLHLVNGVKNGWQKKYFNKEGQPVLGYVDFYDQKKQICISTPISEDKKNHSAFARFYIDTAYYYFEIKYRKTGKTTVKQLISLGQDYRSKNKLKFNSLKELEYYFINFKNIYRYCKRAGFFGQTNIK